jgi:hypothetical protein
MGEAGRDKAGAVARSRAAIGVRMIVKEATHRFMGRNLLSQSRGLLESCRTIKLLYGRNPILSIVA